MDSIKERNCVVVSVRGKLDSVSSPDFERGILEIISTGEKNVLLDCASLEYISSAGLRSILGTAKKLRQGQGRLLFCCVNGCVRDVFRMSGFGSLFEICAAREDALKKF